MDESKIQQLVNLFKTDPDAFSKECASIDDDLFQEVYTRCGFKPDDIIGDTDYSVAMCVTNWRKQFLSRFMMTGLTGFIYEMARDWEPSAEDRTWKYDGVSEATTTPLSLKSLKSRLNTLNTLVEKMDTLSTELQQLREKSLSGDDIAIKKRESEINNQLMLTNYSVHGTLSNMGKQCSGALHALREECEKISKNNKVARQIIDKYPPPPVNEVTMPLGNAKSIIMHFLNEYLKYDPSIHARAGNSVLNKGGKLSVNPADGHIPSAAPSENPLDASYKDLTYEEIANISEVKPTHTSALECILATPRYRSAVFCLIHENDPKVISSIKLALDAPADFRRYIAPALATAIPYAVAYHPPQDTFHRFHRYIAENYEALSAITMALYNDRIWLDMSINILKVWHGTEDEREKKYKEFVDQYNEQISMDILHVKCGEWLTLSDVKGNREKLEYYNRNTEVMKQIMDRFKDDAKVGAELMKNRVTRSKAQNIKETGPDPAGLAEYKRLNASKGMSKVISDEEAARLAAAKGDIHKKNELAQLDIKRSRRSELIGAQSQRSLLPQENIELESLTKEIADAERMLSVPDNAVQIDVHTYDTTHGVMKKDVRFIKAETREDVTTRTEAIRAAAEKK